MNKFLLGCFLVLHISLNVECYPAAQKLTIMDQIYEEIESYVKSKRDSIARSEDVIKNPDPTQLSDEHNENTTSDNSSKIVNRTKNIENVTADEKANELDHFLSSGQSNSTNSTFSQDEDTNASINDLNEELHQNDAESNELKFNSTSSGASNNTYNNDHDLADYNVDDGSSYIDDKNDTYKDDGSGLYSENVADISNTSDVNNTAINNGMNISTIRRNKLLDSSNVTKTKITTNYLHDNANTADNVRQNTTMNTGSSREMEDSPLTDGEEDSADDLNKSFNGETINIKQNYDDVVENADTRNQQTPVKEVIYPNNLKNMTTVIRSKNLGINNYTTSNYPSYEDSSNDKEQVSFRDVNTMGKQSLVGMQSHYLLNTKNKENTETKQNDDDADTDDGIINNRQTTLEERNVTNATPNVNTTDDSDVKNHHRQTSASTGGHNNVQEEDNDIQLNLFKPMNKENDAVMSLVNVSDSLASNSTKEWENDDPSDDYSSSDNATLDSDSPAPVYTPWGLSRESSKPEGNMTVRNAADEFSDKLSSGKYHQNSSNVSNVQANQTGSFSRTLDEEGNDKNVFLPNSESIPVNNSRDVHASDDQEPLTIKKESDSAVNVLKAIVGDLGENDQDLNVLLSDKDGVPGKQRVDGYPRKTSLGESKLSNVTVKIPSFRKFGRLKKNASIFLSDTKHKSEDGDEVRTKRNDYYDHNHNMMGMHNHPYHSGGDFMHGGGHDEFHSIDEHGGRMDLGSVEMGQQPQVNVHESPHFDIHEQPHFHHIEPHNEYKQIHNEPHYYHQDVRHEPHYHSNYYHDDPHYEQNDYHYHDNHHEHYHHQPHYLHNEVHIHHDHENFHDEPEEYHSGDSENYHNRRFHHVKVKLHGPGKSPNEWADQEEQENSEMPQGEHDELNNYDTAR